MPDTYTTLASIVAARLAAMKARIGAADARTFAHGGLLAADDLNALAADIVDLLRSHNHHGNAAADSVNGVKLDGGAIADHAIAADHIADGAVGKAAIVTGCIDGDLLAADSVGSQHLCDAAVLDAAIAAKAVGLDKLSDEVQALLERECTSPSATTQAWCGYILPQKSIVDEKLKAVVISSPLTADGGPGRTRSDAHECGTGLGLDWWNVATTGPIALPERVRILRLSGATILRSWHWFDESADKDLLDRIRALVVIASPATDVVDSLIEVLARAVQEEVDLTDVTTSLRTWLRSNRDACTLDQLARICALLRELGVIKAESSPTGLAGVLEDLCVADASAANWDGVIWRLQQSAAAGEWPDTPLRDTILAWVIARLDTVARAGFLTMVQAVTACGLLDKDRHPTAPYPGDLELHRLLTAGGTATATVGAVIQALSSLANIDRIPIAPSRPALAKWSWQACAGLTAKAREQLSSIIGRGFELGQVGTFPIVLQLIALADQLELPVGKLELPLEGPTRVLASADRSAQEIIATVVAITEKVGSRVFPAGMIARLQAWANVNWPGCSQKVRAAFEVAIKTLGTDSILGDKEWLASLDPAYLFKTERVWTGLGALVQPADTAVTIASPSPADSKDVLAAIAARAVAADPVFAGLDSAATRATVDSSPDDKTALLWFAASWQRDELDRVNADPETRARKSVAFWVDAAAWGNRADATPQWLLVHPGMAGNGALADGKDLIFRAGRTAKLDDKVIMAINARLCLILGACGLYYNEHDAGRLNDLRALPRTREWLNALGRFPGGFVTSGDHNVRSVTRHCEIVGSEKHWFVRVRFVRPYAGIDYAVLVTPDCPNWNAGNLLPSVLRRTVDHVDLRFGNSGVAATTFSFSLVIHGELAAERPA